MESLINLCYSTFVKIPLLYFDFVFNLRTIELEKTSVGQFCENMASDKVKIFLQDAEKRMKFSLF